MKNAPHTATVWGKAMKLGDTELITFKHNCAVPTGAQHIPTDGQAERIAADGATWVVVEWTWRM